MPPKLVAEFLIVPTSNQSERGAHLAFGKSTVLRNGLLVKSLVSGFGESVLDVLARTKALIVCEEENGFAVRRNLERINRRIFPSFPCVPRAEPNRRG